MEWEYKALSISFNPPVDARQIEKALNGLGAEEWELVSASSVTEYGGGAIQLILILKRRKG